MSLITFVLSVGACLGVELLFILAATGILYGIFHYAGKKTQAIC